jgi:hypothetical protein
MFDKRFAFSAAYFCISVGELASFAIPVASPVVTVVELVALLALAPRFRITAMFDKRSAFVV